MAYYSGFQAFQRNAFQIKGRANEPDNGWLGGGYVHPHVKYRDEEAQRERIAQEKARLQRIENELAEAERKRLEALAEAQKRKAKKAAKQLAALEASLQDEINRLRIERIWLMRRIDDEECALILMLRKKRRLI